MILHFFAMMLQQHWQAKSFCCCCLLLDAAILMQPPHWLNLSHDWWFDNSRWKHKAESKLLQIIMMIKQHSTSDAAIRLEFPHQWSTLKMDINWSSVSILTQNERLKQAAYTRLLCNRTKWMEAKVMAIHDTLIMRTFPRQDITNKCFLSLESIANELHICTREKYFWICSHQINLVEHSWMWVCEWMSIEIYYFYDTQCGPEMRKYTK